MTTTLTNSPRNALSTASNKTPTDTLPDALLALDLLHGTIAVDFETFYDSDYTLKDLHPWHYCRDQRFDAYLVSIVGRLKDGSKVEYVGHPADFGWDLIKGCTWLSHNVGFDRNVYRALREKHPNFYPAEPANWHCTGNLAVFVGAQRSLGAAAEHLLNIRVDKTIRNTAMKGKHWADFDSELKAAVKLYALGDSYLCAGIWAKCSNRWPENERKLSQHTYDMGDYGICLDVAKAELGVRALGEAMHAAELLIPWRHEHPLLSPKQFGLECRRIGINPPSSLALSSEEADEWFDKHGDDAPFAGAMRTWRRANALREKLKTMLSRVKPDGRMCYSLLYMGGHTGRWSGSGGFNLQNLPRASQYLMIDGTLLLDGPQYEDISRALKKGYPTPGLKMEFNFRNLLVAAPGCTFNIADLAQIEARILPWLAGDTESLKLMEQGMSIYEVHARKAMGWKGGKLKVENPVLYLLAKARVLALGFQAGHLKFIYMAGLYIGDEAVMDQIFGTTVNDAQIEIYVESQTRWLKDPLKKEQWFKEWNALTTKERTYRVNAWMQVEDFRGNNPKIVALWESLKYTINENLLNRTDFEFGLPSGRSLHYFNPIGSTKTGVKVRFQMGGHDSYIYGGLATENIVQATGRDILAEAILRIEAAGSRVIMHVHDEVVCEVPLGFDAKRVLELMRVRPSWAQTLPIDAELTESPFYVK